MLRVGRAEDVAIGVEGKQICHVTADGREVGDDAVVHEDVSAEHKWVRVYLCYDAAAACADVGKDAVGLGVFAEGLEVEVVDGWAGGFVESRSRACYVLNV
jgi:hypothetical protein